MKRTLYIGIAIILFSYSATRAQYIVNEADKQYALFNYAKAIDLYEQAWKKKETLHTAERLGECYLNQNNYREAESWYAIASGMQGSDPKNILQYANALRSNSKYLEAKAQYQKYVNLNKAVSPVQQSLWLSGCDSAMRWMREPTSAIISNEKAMNSAQSDWGAVKLGNGTVFSSDRGTAETAKDADRPFLKFDGAKVPDKNVYGWTGNRYLRLYQQDGNEAKPFPITTGTGYHVGPASFTADGSEMYFTLTRIPKDTKYEKVKGIDGRLATVNVEIYSSIKGANGNWGAPVAFQYNNVNSYSVGDPFVSADGKMLYFASTMPGGRGGSDLYACFRTEGGGWGKPINLEEFNTEGNERSPFFTKDDIFYFSSDGQVGMGGLDIFRSVRNAGKMTKPMNMGYPTNSPQDDFAYSRTNTTTGYLSSNRTGGLGEDDIYSFAEQKMLIALKLQGVVYNKQTKMPLANAMVDLDKTEGDRRLRTETDSAGKFSFVLQENSAYLLTANKTNFRRDEDTLSTVGLKKSTTLERNLYLEPIELNKPIRLENIYYDFDKADIRPDAAIELDKLVKIMQDNPTIWIELGSHTDSRGNDQYNQWLSQRRANSAVQYIIDRGIAKNRITAKGYGESQLLNQCANGVKCTEAEHQLNRRTEFRITKQ